MDTKYVKKNLVRLSVCVFVIIYMVLISSKSSYLYAQDGSLREFGIGKSGKTVLPAWLVAIVLGILVYFSACLYSSGIYLRY